MLQFLNLLTGIDTFLKDHGTHARLKEYESHKRMYTSTIVTMMLDEVGELSSNKDRLYLLFSNDTCSPFSHKLPEQRDLEVNVRFPCKGFS